MRTPRPRLAVAIAVTLAVGLGLGLARAAPATGQDEVGSGTMLGVGFGPPARLGGALAGRFAADGTSGRIRLGGRVARLVFELDTSIAALRGGDLDHVGYLLATPTVGYLAVAHPHVQLALRGGLGYGVISGQRAGPVPPCGEPPCAGPSAETIEHRGYGLDLGATGALHLGRRRGGRAVLWADLSIALVRFQLPDAVVGGRVVILTFGIGHGNEL